MSAAVESTSSRGGSNSHSYFSSSSSSSSATHSSTDLSDDSSGGSSSSSSLSLSSHHSASSSRSHSSHSSDAHEAVADGMNSLGGDSVPRKLPRLEDDARQLHPFTRSDPIGRPIFPAGSGSSIFPAPQLPDYAAATDFPPRYGPVAPQTKLPPPPPPPALPTLSASAKDLTEMDVRAGVRLGVHWAPSKLNKEQVMDEVESVRMTSSVERVLLEGPPPVGQPGVPAKEKEFEWVTVFFADAEAAELCVARFCQPGRRSKWSWLCLQRLPVKSLVTAPLTTAEDQRYRVHAYQLESSATATPGISAATTSALPDTVLARGFCGWCVVSTSGLFPTLGLANYLRSRRNGTFSSVGVCAAFDADADHDMCGAGGQCDGLHMRDSEQWKLLLPVMLPVKTAVGTPPHLKPTPIAIGAAATPQAETRWQQARHYDCLVVKPLPADIDESGFVYMFRGCKGFLRAQTVRTVDQVRYGVVQFVDAASAEVARQQAKTNTSLSVCFYSEVSAALGAASAAQVASSSVLTTPHSGTAATAGAQEEGREVPCAQGSRNSGCGSEDRAEAGASPAPGLPFPPLPEGWEYGLSRRTMQYFFLQSGKKSTTWKHPVTQEQYKAKR